ncbi:MAG: transporter [Proteobacteria bacterium]|nr:transporter [Pseudomonadota bacterium]
MSPSGYHPSMTFRFYLFSALCTLCIMCVDVAHANDVEPRLYSNVPVGTNFLSVGYAYSSGEVSFDASVPVQDVDGEIEVMTLSYSRGLNIAGRSGLLTVILPYMDASLTGLYLGQPASGRRIGWSDPVIRMSVNLYGAPALALQDFATWQQRTIVGATVSVGMPFGRYFDDKLINTGTNRWSTLMQVGASHQRGRWTLEAATGVSLSTDNDEALGDNTLELDPLWLFRTSLQYRFRPGLWAGVGALYIHGGATTLNGIERDDEQRNWRLGAAVSMPLARRHSVLFRVTEGLASRFGSDFLTYGATYTYTF